MAEFYGASLRLRTKGSPPLVELARPVAVTERAVASLIPWNVLKQ